MGNRFHPALDGDGMRLIPLGESKCRALSWFNEAVLHAGHLATYEKIALRPAKNGALRDGGVGGVIYVKWLAKSVP